MSKRFVTYEDKSGIGWLVIIVLAFCLGRSFGFVSGEKKGINEINERLKTGWTLHDDKGHAVVAYKLEENN